MSALALVLTLLLSADSPAPAPQAITAAPLTAAELLARSKAAQGGAAWDAIRSLHTVGTLSTGGLAGKVDSLTDVGTGRFRDAFELGPMKGASGFDGTQAWSQDGSGTGRVDGAETPRQTAITEAYRRAQAWWYPDRLAGEVQLLEGRSEGERRFHVLRVAPAGGRPFEVWVDPASGLFDRFVEQVGGLTFTTFLADWRPVNGALLPFTARTARDEDRRHDSLVTLTEVKAEPPAEPSAFALPAPPAPDFGFAGGVQSTTVPFELANGHIYLDVRLNGRGPFRLLLDTGATSIVTPAVATALGLEVKGALPGSGVGEKTEDIGLTEVARVEVGQAFMERQPFAVFALDQLDKVEGVAMEGLLGYELLRRFVARIDYQARRLTLLDAAGFRHAGPGAVLPFVFNGQVPQVDGEVDGIPGKFDLDTGSRASLDLLAPFVKAHGLVERYGARQERIGGWGIGGPSRQLLARAKLLKLGPVGIPAPVIGLATSTRGAFAMPDVAGNVGAGVLSRFTVTLDYGRQQVMLERNARFDRKDAADKSGLWLHMGIGGWEVIEVVPGTPAAEAGLLAGERVLTVDGKKPSALPLPELRRRLREEAAGTVVTLRVSGPGGERTVKLTLRDLV